MLLDTDVCISVLRRREVAIRWLQRQSPDSLAISSITLFELHRGIEGSQDPVKEENNVAHFLRPIQILPFTDLAAGVAGRIAAALDKKGQGIGPFDTLIAGHALATGRTLATANVREFSRVSGLKLEQWSKE